MYIDLTAIVLYLYPCFISVCSIVALTPGGLTLSGQSLMTTLLLIVAPGIIILMTVMLFLLLAICKLLFSMASKPINIRWIRTGSRPYWKIICSIVLQTIFHEYWNRNYKIKSSFVSPNLERKYFVIIIMKNFVSSVRNNPNNIMLICCE